MHLEQNRLIVGISGASGAVYGVRLLETLGELPVTTHLIMTKAAEMTLSYETDQKVGEVRALADIFHPINDIGAAPSTGSFPTLGSMKSLAEIATGVTSNLLTRAADVTLKERRRLVVVPRETPLHAVHLRNMLTLTEMGAIVAPPVPAFYARPRDLAEMVDQTVGRLLDLFGLDTGRVRRWRLSEAKAGRRQEP
jgi:4-hydroxy-3-polyprenylbenzoate decarboxylase